MCYLEGDFPTSCSVPVAIMASIIDEQKENAYLRLSQKCPDQFCYFEKQTITLGLFTCLMTT